MANVRADLKEDISNVRTEVTKVRGELKEDIAKLETKLTGLILNSQLKMEESLKGQSRWMIGIFITVVMMILGLYFKE